MPNPIILKTPQPNSAKFCLIYQLFVKLPSSKVSLSLTKSSPIKLILSRKKNRKIWKKQEVYTSGGNLNGMGFWGESDSEFSSDLLSSFDCCSLSISRLGFVIRFSTGFNSIIRGFISLLMARVFLEMIFKEFN